MNAAIVIFFFWVIPYVIGWKLCPAKERSLWWPVLFGWIGILVVVLMPSGGKKCPACAETVRSEASVCKHCGHAFGKAAPA